MDNAWKMINGIVGNLTDVLIGVLGLGIVGALVFGDVLGHEHSQASRNDELDHEAEVRLEGNQ